MSDDFWDALAPLQGEGLIEEGTIMGGPCVRADGEFVAMPNHKGAGLVVKLPKDQVAGLIASDEGQPFAPAGKVFSEWVLIEDFNRERWQELVRESVAFVNP